MKNIIVLLFLLSNVFALNDVTKPFNFSPRDTMKSSRFNANFDTLYNRINQNNDSTDIGFIRWYDFNSHDSTLKYLNVDTVRSNPNIDSIAGDVKFSGAPTIAGTLTTQAISGTTGSFSGALTGTTVNTGNGANELYPMDQDQRTTASPTHVLGSYTEGVRAYNATSDGSYIGLFKGLGSLSEYPSNRYPTIKTDNANMYFDCSGKYVGAIGLQSFYIRDTSTSGGFVFYVHNDTTNAKIIKADSIKLGTGDYLNAYDTGSFADTVTTMYFTEQRTSLVHYIRIGNVVTLTFDTISGTSVISSMRFNFGAIPTSIRPTGDRIMAFCLENDGALVVSTGLLQGSGTYLRAIYPFTTTGIKGVLTRSSFTYTIN